MSIYKTAATLPFGSRVLTIATVSYVAQTFRTRSGSSVVERQTEDGEPNGAVGVPEADDGSATLQLATATTAIPARFAEFTEDTITYFITEVGKPEEQRGFKTVEISFRQKI
jgi:hypothetical protein